jgi:hypothetical protein
MKRERSDIQFIMWRKRVDMTLLLSGQTPIPTWLVKQWQLKEVFDFSSKSHLSLYAKDRLSVLSWKQRPFNPNHKLYTNISMGIAIFYLVMSALRFMFIL